MNTKITKLIQHLTRLPGIGPRQATRLALAMADWDNDELREFGDAVSNIKNGPLFCGQCFNFADGELCSICSSSKRDRTRIAVVEKITDLRSMEKTGAYDGVYHVLGGVLQPGNKEKIKTEELFQRVASLPNPSLAEIIIATNPNTYGETTALYIREKLAPLGIRITRLAQGLSTGSSIEYSDETTLAHALKHRR
ncbi:MAG: recombination mediator RecR [bacterium]|nr:recombination mediator RecR [bacterium]